VIPIARSFASKLSEFIEITKLLYRLMDQNSTKMKKVRRGKECAAFGCSNTEYLRDGKSSGFLKFPSKHA